jgi:hypothetical protein
MQTAKAQPRNVVTGPSSAPLGVKDFAAGAANRLSS